jgi:hypothetical protein
MQKMLFMMPLFFASNSFAAENAIDRWANAIGGREKVAAVKSVYREATITVAGYEGTIKAWHTGDGHYRKEEQIGTVLSTIETFDGTNAAVQRGASPARPLAGAELERARSTGLANWNAVFFAFFAERRRGSVAIEGDDMIVLKPEGGIEWRVTLDRDTWLPKMMVHQEGDRSVNVSFVSYETIEGIKFEKEIHRSNGDPGFNAIIRFTKTIINPAIDAALFSIGPKNSIEPQKTTEARGGGDPSGHWEGAIQGHAGELKIELDLGRDPKGEFTGTLGSSAQHLKGFPLSNFAVEGNLIGFQVKGAPGERAFKGTLSADGKSISGDYSQGGGSTTFTVTRTGAARIAAAARNAPIAKEFEGAWNGTLDVDGKQSRLVLTMSNRSDGATGHIVKIDEGLEIPIAAITQKASSLTLDLAAVSASYSGSLNPEGTELAGTLTLSEGALRLPVNFRRSVAREGKK